MLLVVDANILISILIAKGSKHKLFFSEKIASNSPDRILFEIGKHWSGLSDKSGLSENDLEMEFSLVRMQLNTYSLNELSEWIKEGAAISPDPDDAEYFALALKLNCPIWSEEKRLKKQSKVKVYNTVELLKELGLKK
mgnify:CR=1 FL=1